MTLSLPARAGRGRLAETRPMGRFVLSRLLSGLPTLIGMSLIGFAVVSLAPGDPVAMELRAMGVVASPEDVAALRAEYGLDRPFLIRWLDWLGRAATLDFGRSIATGRSVAAEIGLHLPATLALAISGLIGAILLSLALGVGAASGGLVGGLLRAATVLLVSAPSFWLALLLIDAFVLRLGWARLVGDGSLRDLALPALTLSLATGAALGRVVCERVRAEMAEDHVRLAIAKGLGPRAILLGHVAPGIVGPLATAWASAFGALLGGAVIVESIFGWPGLGRLALQAIAQRDYPVLQAYLVLMGLAYFVTSLIADIAVVLADPALRRRLGDG